VAGWIATQEAQKISHFAQMRERIAAGRGIWAADEIQIEQVLPWAATPRPGFDLGQIDVTQREYGQATEQ
jgi:hypothetical protein